MEKQTEAAADRVEELRLELENHNHRYYILDDPVITDGEYDALLRELQDLEREHPQLASPNSPTQRVGSPPADRFNKVRHHAPMLSLGNAFDADELRAYCKRIASLLDTDEIDFVTELKIDGAALALTYQHGELVRGATRGDGETGEEVTANLRTIRTIPLRLKIDQPPPLIEVRAEGYLPLSAFERMNEERLQAGLNLYANPRNTAAGALRQLDPAITATRPLACFAYGIGYVEGLEVNTQMEALGLLAEFGFRINDAYRHHPSIESVIEFCQEWEQRRNSLDYEIDGVVVKVNHFSQQEILGTVGREPRWAIAYKFPGQTATTRLLEIRINVGRTGALNPYAVLEPVELAGVTIRTATLHNQEDIRRKDIREGDTVIVKRAGDVIPQVVGPVTALRDGTEKSFTYPEKCPECEFPVSFSGEDAMAYCTNALCPAQRLESLKHFVSRGAMDIRGLGPQTLEKMVELGLVKTPADLYALSRDQLLELPNYKERSVDNLLGSLEESKQRSFARVLFALGIRHVGETVAQLITSHFGSRDRLLEASVEEISSINGIGPEIANSLSEYLRQPTNRELIERLAGAGLQMTAKQPAPASGPLVDLTFVITGTLPTLSRNEAKELIEASGGKVTAAISKRTSYLLIGENPGSKQAKAVTLGVPQIDEEGLYRLISDNAG